MLELKNNSMYTQLASIKEICSPLSYINITGFYYTRLFSDNSFINLSTCLPWSEFFLGNLLQAKYKKDLIANNAKSMFSEGINLWDLDEGNQIFQEGKRYFNCAHGITFVDKHASYIDNFSFYTDSDHQQINHFYLSNLDKLKTFTHYFTEKAASIIKFASRERFILPSLYCATTTATQHEDIITPVDRFSESLGNTTKPLRYDPRLTKREFLLPPVSGTQ